MAAASLAAPLTSRLVLGRPRFRAYPFTLGVASGDPVADGFVIWTRLAPDPLNGGGMFDEAIPVRWEIAQDQRFLGIVKRGETVAAPEFGHSVHVDVSGLEPDRWYYYRFISGGEASPIGRTRTFPAASAAADRFRFAFASCQHFQQGYFTAYQAMMEDDLDLIVHLGDYIYESSWGTKVRFHRGEPITLTDYRNHHALYKTDPSLQAAHAWHPFAMTWDDHEVDNDYAGDQSEEGTAVAEFLKRRAAAYQAYYEHMPLRATARPAGSSMTLFTTHRFGNLASIVMLDNRQYRSDQPCATPEKLGGQLIEKCAEREQPERTMLGPTQERWLLGQLSNAQAQWKVIGQQMLMAQLEQKQGEGEAWWSDGWDGYPAGRQRILGHIAERGIHDVVVIGGDIHSFWVTDLKEDFSNPDSKTVATEFVGTSITSAGLPYDKISALLPENPHIRFFDSRERGYVLADVTPSQWRSELRVVNSITAPQATARTLKTYTVEAGRAGAQLS